MTASHSNPPLTPFAKTPQPRVMTSEERAKRAADREAYRKSEAERVKRYRQARADTAEFKAKEEAGHLGRKRGPKTPEQLAKQRLNYAAWFAAPGNAERHRERCRRAQKAWREANPEKQKTGYRKAVAGNSPRSSDALRERNREEKIIRGNMSIVFHDEYTECYSRVRRGEGFTDEQVNENRRQLCEAMGWEFRPAEEVWTKG